jgi:hypothetical protein
VALTDTAEVALFAAPTYAPEVPHDFAAVTVTVQTGIWDAQLLAGAEDGAVSRCSRFPPRVAEAMPQSRATIVKRMMLID